MSRRSKAAASSAATAAAPNLPDLGGLEDLEDGADAVSEKEMAAVLLELLPAAPASRPKKNDADEELVSSLLGGKSRQKQPAAAPKPASTASVPAQGTLGDRVNARLKELQVAAVSAKQSGSAQEALLYLRRSKEFAASVEALLISVPNEEAAPVARSADGQGTHVVSPNLDPEPLP